MDMKVFLSIQVFYPNRDRYLKLLVIALPFFWFSKLKSDCILISKGQAELKGV